MIHKKSKQILHSKKKSKKNSKTNYKKKTRVINKKTRVINKRSTNITRKNKKSKKAKKTLKKIKKKTRKQNLNNIIGGKVVTGIFTREQELESPFKDNLMNKFKDLIKVKMQQLKYNDNEIGKIEGKLNNIDLNNKNKSNRIFNTIKIQDNSKSIKLNKFLDNIYLKIQYKKKKDDQNNTNKLFLYVTLLFIKQNLKRIRRDILENFTSEKCVLINEKEYKENKTKFKKYSFLRRSLINPANIRRWLGP